MQCIDQYIKSDTFALYCGDSCQVIKGIPSKSVDFSIFSPPFSSLFVYSDSIHDMGNCRSEEEFFRHFSYLAPELLRVTVPGRLLAMHCSDIPSFKYKDGIIGLKDLPGMFIREMQSHGWIYHSRITIWKDPVVEMQRTKAKGLLHKQICKDSAQCRTGVADTLLVFAAPGDAEKPVVRPNGFNPAEYVGTHDPEIKTSIDVWQRYASPVWMDIRQSDTLNVRVARSCKDEKHICPLQLGVIKRAIHLWTMPGDVVFTPFLGIGSEAYCAVLMGRKAIGIELKPEYFNIAKSNVNFALSEITRPSLFGIGKAV